MSWDELETLEIRRRSNLTTFLNGSRAAVIHGKRWRDMRPRSTPREKSAPAKKDGARADTYKTPEQLAAIQRNGTSKKPLSPDRRAVRAERTSFVVHRHHATRLHYDLRLEQDGVLKSWAVPKGLPPRPGIMRLAVKVEDHPRDYVNFEGAIPKGEYGGGMMWKFAQGRYEISKKKKDGFYFRLHSRELNGEYRIHQHEREPMVAGTGGRTANGFVAGDAGPDARARGG